MFQSAHISVLIQLRKLCEGIPLIEDHIIIIKIGHYYTTLRSEESLIGGKVDDFAVGLADMRRVKLHGITGLGVYRKHSLVEKDLGVISLVYQVVHIVAGGDHVVESVLHCENSAH